MQSHPLRRTLIVILALFAVTALPARAADASGLVGALVSQLGVTPEQATGGAGLLLSEAREAMAPGDWSQVAAAIPDIASLLAAAPTAESAAPASGFGGMLGQAASRLGSESGMAALAPGFQALGLDPTMVSRFVPVIVGFVQSEAGQQTASLLGSTLRSMI
jgi:hypothetical protein